MFKNAATVTVSLAYKLSGINLKWPCGFFNPLIKSFEDTISKGITGCVTNIEVHVLYTVFSLIRPT